MFLFDLESVKKKVWKIPHLGLTPPHLRAKVWKIVKLRRGSGKDRQGMAPKVKGLKA